MDQRHKALRQGLLRRTHRWGWHVPVSFRHSYAATDKKLLMLVEYINIAVLCVVERLQKGIVGMQEECCEVSQYGRLLQGWAIEGYGGRGWCHAA
jgi:hypothetical protein